MLTVISRGIKALLLFSDYKPQPVTFQTLRAWLKQFDQKDWALLLKLLNKVKFVTEKETRSLLVERNIFLLNKLKKLGINNQNMVFVSFGDAGSSSHAMLNLLRDAARLERKGYKFFDAKDRDFIETVRKMEEGAIIYVDDFIGSGKQFCTSRDFVAAFIPPTVSQHLLAVCICEEAYIELGKRGVEGQATIYHSMKERSLHDFGSLLTAAEKDRLLLLCKKFGREGGLGFNRMATNVVLYRNAPNSLPWIFRGSLKQTQMIGILPRTTDL